jgi:hypothetical protein
VQPTSTATNGVYHFNLITFAQDGRGVLATRHDFQTDFNRQAAPGQIQTVDQPGNGCSIGQFECFTV